MKDRKVLSPENLPTRLPVGLTVLCWLALDYWNAPQWLWGVLGAIFLLLWINVIARIATEDRVDLLKNKDKY